MTKPVIEVKDLAKSFGENDVLKDITEKVEPGQVIVVIGPSGGGKVPSYGAWTYWRHRQVVKSLSKVKISRRWIPRALTRFVKNGNGFPRV